MSEMSDSLEKLDRDLSLLHMDGHWTGGTSSLPLDYETSVVPHVWRWRDVYPHLMRAGELISLEQAERRTLRLKNPGAETSLRSSSQTLHVSFQYVKPGEVARAHRHTMAALRFVVQGHGAYTTVDGQRCRMAPGDLILTPSRSWHDHTNDGDAPIVWLDGHDGPLLRALHQLQLDMYEARAQEIVAESEDQASPFAKQPPSADSRHRPALHYKFSNAAAELERIRKANPTSPAILKYPSVFSGDSTLHTIDCRLILLSPSQRTAPVRRTTTSLFHVFQGSGRTVFVDRSLSWVHRDTFVVPLWEPFQLSNDSDEDVILFEINDSPVLKALNLLRSENLSEEWQELAPPESQAS